MITVRAPYRISIVGGGTDVFGKGAVISFAINKYCYVTVMFRKDIDNKVICTYSKREVVDDARELQNELLRETLLKLQVYKGVEVHLMSDLPMVGCGLGTSGALLVALVKALRPDWSASHVAHIAAEIERDRCHRGCGKQDHFASALGGCNYLAFHGDSVFVESLDHYEATARSELQKFRLFHFVNDGRDASNVLASYTDDPVQAMGNLVTSTHTLVHTGMEVDWDRVLRQGWTFKKKFSPEVSTPELDELLQNEGKLCGAGIVGYILLYEQQLPLPELKFDVDYDGVSIMRR